jgi:DNA-binding transcriptional LysR family regulator
MLSDHFAEPYVRSGELVQVLADWNLPAATAWAVFPGRRLMPTRTRVFLDAMQAEFSGPRCQQKAAQFDQSKRERHGAVPRDE